MSSLLNEYLGSFIEGLDASQLSLRVWSGKVHLTNLTVKSTALDQFQLPVSVAFGRVDDLRLECNWRSLGSQPVRIELSGVSVRLQPRSAFTVDKAAVVARQLASKLSSLNAVHEFRLQAETEAAKSSSSTASYMRRLTATIVDNVQISVRDIHFTYTSPDNQVTVGVGLEELSAYTTDSEWQRGFFASSPVTYRLVSLRNVFAYMDDTKQAAAQRSTAEVLSDQSTRFLLSPLSGSARMTMNKDESVSPRITLSSSFQSLAVSVAQPQYRHMLRLLSEVSKSNNTLQSALSSASSSSATADRALTRDERRRYTDYYKRTLNALWLPELTADERADMARVEREGSYTALAQARTHGWYELKKELAGRTVMAREAGKDASKGNTGLLKGWFGSKKADISHEELTEQQREDLYAIVDAEEQKDGAGNGGVSSSHSADWVLIQLAVSLDRLSLALLDKRYVTMLQLNAEKTTSRVVKREASMAVELGVHSLTCDDSMLPATLYPQLIAMQQQANEQQTAFVALTYEDTPPHSDYDKRLCVTLNAPVVTLHRPLIAALLRFFSLPEAVDLQSFSAWSMAQLEALRAYSTNTLADALSKHATLDLQVQLTAPVIAVPIDPLSANSDVLVLNLGQVNINTDVVQSKQDIADTLQTLSDINTAAEAQLSDAVKGRLYDHYRMTVSHTSLALSSRGPQWREDAHSAYLLTPLDLTVDLALCISRDVNQLPNIKVTGQLPHLSLTISNRQLARLTAFVDTFGQIQQLPQALTCTLDGEHQQANTEPAVSITPHSTQFEDRSIASNRAACGAESSEKQLDVDDLTELMNGDSQRAREVLAAIDKDGDGVVEWSEFVSWEHRRQRSRAHKQLFEARFTLQEAALCIEREASDGLGEAEVIVVARVSSVDLRLLKETYLTRVGVSIGRLSAQEMSPQAEGRLLLDTDIAASAADATSTSSVTSQSVAPLERGFIVVDLVHMAQESPDFEARRIESSVDVRVGELKLLIDVASAYRLGSFVLFEMLPAATSSTSSTVLPSTSQQQPIVPVTPAVSSPHPIAAASPTGRSRSYQTRLVLHASFQRLSVLVGVGRELVSELHVSGCEVDVRQYLHALSATARLQAITLRDCTVAGRRYANVLTSLVDASKPDQPMDKQQRSSDDDTALITLQYDTYSPLDQADDDNSDGAEAALRARIRGLQFVVLRRFIDENLALLLTGPVAQLIHEKKRRDRRQQQQRASNKPAAPPTAAYRTQRRRSSISAALLTPAALSSAPGGVVSPLSATHFLRLDCQLSGIDVIVPYHSQSDQMVQARFDAIAVSSARMPHQRTRLAANFSAFTITSSLGSSRRSEERRTIHLLSLDRLTATADSDEQSQSVEADIQVGDVRCSLSPSQYQLLLTLPDSNLSEQGHVSRHMLKQLSPLSHPATSDIGGGRTTVGPNGASGAAGESSKPAVAISSFSTSTAPPATPVIRPSPVTGTLPSITLTVRATVPRVELQLIDESGNDGLATRSTAEQTSRQSSSDAKLLCVSVIGLGCFLTRQPDGGLEVQAGMQAVTAVDNSAEGDKLGDRQVLSQRKELLVIGASGEKVGQQWSDASEHSSQSEGQQGQSTGRPHSGCPLSLTVGRTVSADGLNRTVVDVSLDNFRFTMGAVLIRLRSFLYAQPPTLLEPDEDRHSNEQELDYTLLAAAQTEEQPPPSPSVLAVHVRMTRPTFQLVADPTIAVSPALLFSWSAALDVELDRSGNDERLSVSGAVRDVCCYVTQLTVDNSEAEERTQLSGLSGAEMEAKSDAALILQPFSANLRLRQTGPLPLNMRAQVDERERLATPLLPRRTGSVEVERVVLRFSYSSYKLVSTTVDALLAQQPTLTASASSSGDSAASLAVSSGVSLYRASSTDCDKEAAVSDEFSVTDTSSADSASVRLFSEEDVSFSISCLHVLLINDCLASDVPLAKLTVDAVSGALHGFAHHRNARCTLTLAMELFDPSLVAWSPLLEPYSANISLISAIVPATQSNTGSTSGSQKNALPEEGTVRGAVTHWLQVSSSQSLNVNVSHSMVMGVIDAVALFSRAERSRVVRVQSPSASRTAAVSVALDRRQSTGDSDDVDRDFLPFRFDNQTEFNVRCHPLYALKDANTKTAREPVSTSATSSLEAASSEFGPWTLTAYQSLPFSFPSNSSPVNRSLLVEVDSTLSFPALTVPFTRPSIVQHRMPGRGRPVVLVSEVYIVDGVKVCRLRSRIAVTNRTDLAFDWKQPAGSQRWPSLKPHSTLFLPVLAPAQLAPQLTPSAGGFAYSSPLPMPGRLRQQTVRRFACARTGMPSSSAVSLSFSGDLTCVMSGVSVYSTRLHGRVEDEVAERRKKTANGDEDSEKEAGGGVADEQAEEHTTVYTLRPPVLLENLLVDTMEFRCVDRSKDKGDIVRQQETVSRGATVSLFAPSTVPPCSLSFRLPFLRQQGWTAPLPLLGDRADVDRALKGEVVLVAVRDDEKRELVVHCAYSLVQGAILLSVYVPYFVYDLTGLGLVISADRRQFVPLGRMEEEASGGVPSDDRLAVMFNFPASQAKAPSDQHQVCVTTLSMAASATAQRSGDAAWSSPFNIDALGLRFSTSIPVGGAAGGSLDVAVSIQQGVAVHRRTKVIVLAPRLIFVNSLPHDCLLRQHQTDTVVRIAAGQQHFWQWPDATQKRFLSLNRTGSSDVEGWEWSGLFHPQRVGSTNITVRHTADSQRLWYVRVESRMQESSIFCVLTSYPQQLSTLSAVLPFRVHNRCLFHTVRFRQAKDGVTYGDWLYVPPMSALPYAWEQPLLAGQVQVEVGLRKSIVGERWEASINTPFDGSGQQGEQDTNSSSDQSSVTTLLTVKRLKPLPGDETRGEQQVWIQSEGHGPTRVLVVSSSQPLEQYEQEMRQAAANKRRRLARRDMNEALRARRLSELTTALDQLEVNIAQLTVNKAKTEEKLRAMENGMIDRPQTIAEEDSALLVRVLGVRGVGAEVDVCCSIEFNGSSHRSEWRRAGSGGGVEIRFTAPQAAFRANNLRLSTTCRIELLTRRSERDEAVYGFVDFTLFEYDDHRQQQLWLPICSTSTQQPEGGEMEVSVWWIPVGPRVCRQLLQTMDAVLSEYARVQRVVKHELHELADGRLEGVVGSANTEVQFLVQVTGMQGMQYAARHLPASPGQLVVRVRSELTGKLSSAVLYSHQTDIRQELSTSASVQWGQLIPVTVSEDLLDSRGGETLHFSFLFVPSSAVSVAADSATSLPSPVALAEASVPLSTVPVSRPESSKGSDDEKMWTNRVIPLRPLLWSVPPSSSSSSATSLSTSQPGGARVAELAMTATFRRFVARSDEQRADMKVSVNLPGIALSFISDLPEEILLLSLHTLSITLEQAKVQQTAFIKLEHAQLDNMRPTALFPVVIAPTFVPDEQRQPLLQLSATKQRGVRDQRARVSYNVLSFPYFSVLLQSVDVRVEEELIWTVLSHVNEFSRAERHHTSSQSSSDRQCVRHMSDVRLRGSSQQVLYFQFLQIQPLSFHVSFLAKPGLRAHMGDLLYNPFQLLLSAASSTLGSLDNAPINLNGQIIENASGTSDMLLSSLANFYQDEMLHQAYKLIGSFDFLGNPSELLSHLGTGLSDFFYEVTDWHSNMTLRGLAACIAAGCER